MDYTIFEWILTTQIIFLKYCEKIKYICDEKQGFYIHLCFQITFKCDTLKLFLVSIYQKRKLDKNDL